LIIVLVALVFIGFVTLYTVRFTETAVVTTFGKASTESVKSDPGLYFAVPVVQSVTTYDTRARFVETNPETQQTGDNQQVVVTAYMVWKIDAEKAKTLEFYKRFSGAGRRETDHYRMAENLLRDRLRGSMTQISRFKLSELLASTEGSQSQLPALEKAIFDALTAPGPESLDQYGVRPLSVGITSMGFPSSVTTTVFESMNAARERMAKETTDRGVQEAASIRAEAESQAKVIEQFAQSLAERIRYQGGIEAAEWLKQSKADPAFVAFLENMKFIRESYGRTVTLVLPTSLPGFGAFRPDFLNGLKSGQVPDAGLRELTEPAKTSAVEGDASADKGGRP
jgi:membrane protease subunit HflC